MVQLEKKGFFITLEGGEGAGKSTQCHMLAEALNQEGISCLLTREPGGSVGAEEIRKLLVTGDVGRWDALTEILLFSAARRDHLVKTIWPALENGTVVICDRFIDSTMAYQGYGYGDKPEIQEKINALYRMIADDFRPDLTIILDINTEEGLRRSCTRHGNTEQRFEGMDWEFHQNLRQAFLKFATTEPERYIVIDGTGTPEEIHQKIISAVRERLLCFKQ